VGVKITVRYDLEESRPCTRRTSQNNADGAISGFGYDQTSPKTELPFSVRFGRKVKNCGYLLTEYRW
jgi:hypothetical protein